MRTKTVAPVDHHDRLGDPLQVHRPVERRVTAADDQDPLAGERLQIQHAIVQPFVVPPVDVFERQLARGERADAARDQDRPAGILVLVGHDREARLPVLLAAAQPGDLFRQVHRRLPLQALLGEPFHQVLRENLRKSRNVEDVFLGIERGQLTAHLIEIVDQAV